ncbi:MAG TPA: hypothetical protein VF645_11100 [Allosphingosinicella sp.]|jgi:hypothetical protein
MKSSAPKLVYVGDEYLPHPVTDRLGTRTLTVVDPNQLRQIESADLLIYDCRRNLSDDLADADGYLRKALQAGTPVLFLSPAANDHKGIGAIAGGALAIPSVATLVVVRPGAGGKRADHYALCYPPTGLGDSETRRDGSDQNERTPACCDDRPPPKRVDPSLLAFIRKAKQLAAAKQVPATVEDIPTGLVYVFQTYSCYAPFTYSGDGNSNGAGSLTVSLTVWGFLNQSASQSSQVLGIQSTYSLNPGSLYDDDDQGTGFVNCYLQGVITPSSSSGSFNFIDQAPTTGANSWTETAQTIVNYAPATGGFDTYTYTTTITEALDSWSVQPETSGSSVGPMWYLNSPCNGSDIPNTWSDAFNWHDEVEGFPGPSTGALGTSASAIWGTSNLVTGSVNIGAALGWEGTWFDSEDCFLGICSSTSAYWNWWTWNPVFWIDFTPLQPPSPSPPSASHA